MSLPDPRARRKPPVSARRRALAALPVVAALVVAFLVACGAAPRRQIVLLTVEGVRWSDLDAMPALRSLADRGWSAGCAITPSPDAAAAAGSLLSGDPVPTHGLTDGRAGRISPDVSLVAEELREAGFGTAAFIGTGSIGWASGLSRGFERFDESVFPQIVIEPNIVGQSLGGAVDLPGHRRSPATVVRDAVRWISGREGSFFAWLHMAAQAPNPATDTPEKRTEEAARSLAEIDSALAVFLKRLDEMGLTDRTTVIAVGTSGYGRGEHGEWTSGLELFETTIRVPMILAGPVAPSAPVSAPVSTRLVASFIREAAGLESAAPIESGEAVSVAYAPAGVFGTDPVAALRTEPWVLISNGGQSELYDLSADPDQRNDLAGSEPGRVTELEERLRALDVIPGPPQADAGAGLASAQRARVIAALLDVGRLASGGEVAAARARLDEAMSVAPRSPALLRLLARVRYRAGDGAGALSALEPLRAPALSSPAIALALAKAYREIDAADKEVEILRQATEASASPALRIALSTALARTEAWEEAADALKPLAVEEPFDPRLMETLGDTYLAVGYGYRAAASFERAVDLGFRIPRVVIKLGDCRQQLRDANGAYELFEEASRHKGYEESSHVRMGGALLAMEKEAEAIEQFRKALPPPGGHIAQGLRVAEFLASNGQEAIALVLYQELATANPDRIEPHLAVGDLFLRAGRLDEAERAFRFAADLTPSAPLAHYQLARTAVARNDAAAALEEIRLLTQQAGPALIRQASKDPAFLGFPEGSEIRRLLEEAVARQPAAEGP